MSYICKERLIETIRQRACIELCPQKMACSDDLREECPVNDVVEIVKEFEPDEVDEVKYCSWEERIDPLGGLWAECGRCGWQILMVENLTDRIMSTYKYCPHCGARMDGE